MNGWWKFHRKMLDHAVWGLPGDQVKVWLTLCSNVNIKEGEWFDGKTKVIIQPGSYITSQDHIAKDAKVGRQTVRTAIKNLIRLESISTKIVTNRYTIITVVNWPIYSGDESLPNQEVNQPLTNHQPTANQPLTTTGEGKKEEKEEKERKNPKTSSTVVDKSTPWRPTLDDVRVFLIKTEAPDVFFNETYWLRIDEWVGGKHTGIYYFQELTAYLAWLSSQNGHAKHRDLLRGFRNWLGTKSRMVERDAQRQAIQQRSTSRPSPF